METQVMNQSIELITKAELDNQISTAKAYPRDLERSINNARQLALRNEETAQNCIYALPRGGKTIDGPSVRLAEIVASTYGNIKCGARIIDNDGQTITAQGVCHDLESNYSATVEVKRKITDKNGKTYNQDMQTVTGNAACAIAFRNAVYKVIPAVLIDELFEEVKKKAKGEAGKLTENVNKAIKAFAALGVTEKQILEKLGVKNVKSIDQKKLVTLRGMYSSINNGESTVNDLFESEEEEKPTIDEHAFKGLKESVEAGNLTADEAIEGYQLTDEQIKELKKIK